jgi:hypothetical protein
MLWAAIPASLRADGTNKFITHSAPIDPDTPTVDMFDGIADGDLAVKFIPKDSKEGKVLIENKTDKPLTVKLPDAFAGVPVLAQNAGAAGSSSNNNNANQGVGGGMGGGGGGGGQGGNMFNVPPEKVALVKVTTVCLDHGKAEPRAGVPYEIKPIESVTDKPEVQELCRMLGTGQINQRAAQVAAWHLNNGMSWQELAAKQLRHAGGSSEPYFTDLEIRGGINLAGIVAKAVEQRKQQEKQGASANAPAAQK